MRDLLLQQIPDEPVWVEARGALLAGGDVFGEPGAAIVRNRCKEVICIVGRPTDETFEAAFEDAAETVEVIAQADDAEHGERLMDMPGGEARIYSIGARAPTLPIVEGDYLIEELTSADVPRLRHLPDALREEMEETLPATTVVAAIVDGLPVSFCYPGSLTESLWDVSIDTWEPYRRRGLAAAAIGGMYERMSRQGKNVVWGAMDWNEASWRLADKLSLEQVGTVYVWTAHVLPRDSEQDDPID